MVFPGNQQEYQARIAPGIAWIAFRTHAPAPAYGQGDFRLVSLADGGKGDRDYFRSGGSLEPLNQGIQCSFGSWVEEVGKIVDVAYRLSWKQ
jgi:hypothetical protein